MKILSTQVLIIGGGATGTGIARDLALRGVDCILAEKGDINSGASGANHGLLHSGARYVYKDSASAMECQKEGEILKKLMPHCIEATGGIFAAFAGDEEKYIADFPLLCEKSGIPCRPLSLQEAFEMEPHLSETLIAAYEVNDSTIDPFRLSLDNISQAQELGVKLLRFTLVVGFIKDNNTVKSVRLLNTRSGEEMAVEAEQIINAAGAWAGEIAAMAGCTLGMLFSKGTLLVTNERLTQRVVNHLRPPADADIIVPGGVVSILGTTSIRIDSPDDMRPTVKETDYIINECIPMLPVLASTRFIRSYAGVRPLIDAHSEGDDRAQSREFALLDHVEEGLNNFATVTGGKLTTYRNMAEKTSNLVCKRLGVTAPCLTKTEPLPDIHAVSWTEPGVSARIWFHKKDPTDVLLCECEMVPTSAVDEIVDDIKKKNDIVDLISIGLRSRVGKGNCQGSYCSVRIIAHLYQQNSLESDSGIFSLKKFIEERWRGIRPISWNHQLMQSELNEAIHCGFFSLEL